MGVIGLGNRGRQHASTLMNMPGVTLEAIADIVPSRFRDFASPWIGGGSPRFFNSGLDLLRLADVDAVTIATGNEHHVALTLAAAEQGRHVFVESPSATIFGDVAALGQAARRRLILADGFMVITLHSPGLWQMQRRSQIRPSTRKYLVAPASPPR
jgi:predicted dehydrogenase